MKFPFFVNVVKQFVPTAFSINSLFAGVNYLTDYVQSVNTSILFVSLCSSFLSYLLCLCVFHFFSFFCLAVKCMFCSRKMYGILSVSNQQTVPRRKTPVLHLFLCVHLSFVSSTPNWHFLPVIFSF